ncbi:immunity 51 family protein [Tenacibaculum dicentrarchi]|nr:immunity 51 family protein [Tenacibaculum dicentrarchi]
MENYLEMHKSEEFKSITVRFYNEKDKPLEIGKKMNELNEEAYMNGYNWNSILNFYLSKLHPEILEGLDPDPEGGSYFAHYESTPENEIKAKRFVEIIKHLIENEEILYEMVRNKENDIEWD